MPKFSALIAVLVAFLVVPALASAAPTASQISAPADPAFVTVDTGSAGALHVAGTTSGGTGDVDLRCYWGATSAVLASNVPVTGGAFAADITLNAALLKPTIGYPYPFCRLRAVPAGTVPNAPPNAITEWEGPSIGWGEHRIQTLGAAFAPNSPDTVYDYFVARAQPSALNDFDSAGSCGLCDTYLYDLGSKAVTNPIWWANGGLYPNPTGVSGRPAVTIDGAGAYSGTSAYWDGTSHHLADNPGFPAISVTATVDPVSGNLKLDEHAPFAKCAEDPSVFPPTDASCATFAGNGVVLDREFQTRDEGLQVTMVDHWKSVDGKPHALDAIYDDTERSSNALAGHEANVDFTWTGAGMKTYPANAQIAVPPSVPATMLVKTDASTPNTGDHMNPFGAMTFGGQPSEIKLVNLGSPANLTGEWQTRYQRSIPAGGEVSIAVVYTADLTLPLVKARSTAAQTMVAAPSVAIDSPADGGTVDAATVTVTGTASSPDGQVGVKVNGVGAALTPDGHWSADVPLSEGANQILAVASNALGVTTTATRSVSRPAPSAAAATTTPAPAATAPVVTAKPVRCVVPKLRGKKLTAAKLLLKKAHCRLGEVTRKATSHVKPGRVMATRLKAGSRHRAGTRVRVTIAKARRH